MEDEMTFGEFVNAHLINEDDAVTISFKGYNGNAYDGAMGDCPLGIYTLNTNRIIDNLEAEADKIIITLAERVRRI